VHYTWDFGSAIRFFPSLLDGLLTSVALSALSILLGFALALALYVCRLAQAKPLANAAHAFTECFRALPVLATMVWIFYAFPLLTNLNLLGSVGAACLALALNYAAVQTENLRTGGEAIPPIQIDVARSLQLSPFTVFIRVSFPQALLRSIPAAMSQGINTFKLSALASFLSVRELFFSATDAIQVTLRPVEIYTVMALMYLIVVLLVSLTVDRAQRAIAKRFGWNV
jgi:polar amino acid transport system permease protein